jgi:hypothetical protein
MRTHTQSAHWHAQETVAQTLLAAAHAKRRAAQGRRIHVRWPTRRQRAATARWGAALLAPWVGWRGRVLAPRRGPRPATVPAHACHPCGRDRPVSAPAHRPVCVCAGPRRCDGATVPRTPHGRAPLPWRAVTCGIAHTCSSEQVLLSPCGGAQMGRVGGGTRGAGIREVAGVKSAIQLGEFAPRLPG